MRIGRRRASSVGACCWRRSQPTKTRRPPLASGALGDRPVAEPNGRYAGTNHRIALHICTTIAVRLWHAECSVARYNCSKPPNFSRNSMTNRAPTFWREF